MISHKMISLVKHAKIWFAKIAAGMDVITFLNYRVEVHMSPIGDLRMNTCRNTKGSHEPTNCLSQVFLICIVATVARISLGSRQNIAF